MPAIDPRQLNQDISAAVALADHPEDMVRALREIFSYYSDRTRRPSSVLQSSDTLTSYGSPAPVVRQVRRALSQSINEQEFNPNVQIEALWSAGERELREVAIGLMDLLEWQEAVDMMEKFISQNKDPRIVETISRTGFQEWTNISNETKLAVNARWLDSDSAQLQRLSLLIMARDLGSGSSEMLPIYFDLLAGQTERLELSAHRVLRKVVQQLAQWNPAETAQFLLDEARGNAWSKPYQRLIDDCMDAFPQSQQSEIKAALIAH